MNLWPVNQPNWGKRGPTNPHNQPGAHPYEMGTDGEEMRSEEPSVELMKACFQPPPRSAKLTGGPPLQQGKPAEAKVVSF